MKPKGGKKTSPENWRQIRKRASRTSELGGAEWGSWGPTSDAVGGSAGAKPPDQNWRRRPELNRGWRFCRPLPYRLATAPREPGARNRPCRTGQEVQSTLE